MVIKKILPFRFTFACLLAGNACYACTENPKQETTATSAPNIALKNNQPTIPSSEEISNLPIDGGVEFNRLIFESSPYLLQHSRNPIDWYPWGEEAFKLAEKLDRPIFLSIGYTTCHWCHVMEHESFEDKDVADLLNRNYVCIKVDREERPDIDNVYMSVSQLMTGRGGWPMTIIMSPQKVPFFAGTYFAKSSMLQLLPHFARVWKEEKNKAREVGLAITESLRELQNGHAGGDLNVTHLDACYQILQNNYDPVFGGFGKQPKFPTCHSLSFLLRYHQRTGKKNALEMVEYTLRSIRSGGIYDQIGFGIHRYSTDEKWLVPHFEKMLYDQALFSIANLETYLVTKDKFYLRSCRETLDYVIRKLTSSEGGFYSAEDADSEGEEGKFYLWSMEELIKTLGIDNALLYAESFQFEKNGNYIDEVSHKLTGKNIPYLLSGESEDIIDNEKIMRLRSILFKSREKRIHPQLDDKVLTDWNGLMISAFAKCARALNDKTYLNTAEKAANFCISKLRRLDGKLLKRWRKGKAGLPAHLEDYAFLIQGLIDLYEASFKTKYLKSAIELTAVTIDLFEDEENGGFFFTADNGEKLLVRAKEIYDGAIPSGNSVMAINLARLSKMTNNALYEKKVNSLFLSFSGFIEQNPQGAEVLLQALDFTLGEPLELVVAGDPKSQNTRDLLRAINQEFLPSKVILFKDTTQDDEELFKLIPFLEKQNQIDGKPAVYVCRNQTCDKPRTDADELAQFLKKSSNN